ncbi:hypothetical protein DUNSADRAFT_11509 [Dunaliella salina]|uniref:Uncharacterized protein n=1 Tax=Dunaliella salina TaxID=3046 RepID=A0ABQ7H4F0_DUNSA|nr:hypothetical protein DUNSADRAFT_11509 [Dunaliella salina]|eukprot:KAF5841729.1 hypothetical protein DUNSADRAFT_11509 [Dunaliella salina]
MFTPGLHCYYQAGPGGGNRKICARCNQPTPPGLPLRCSGCKQVYYCSQDCQRKAWPDHKGSCKAMSNSAQPSQPAEPQAPASLPELATQAAAGKEEPKTFQDALAMYLEQNAASRSDKMEATFETAVMQFVKGNYPTAIAQLQTVQSKEPGDSDKAMGHLRESVKIREQTAAYEQTSLIIILQSCYVCWQAAYEQSLEVFELVEDADKVSKVLINLSNMCEMQIKTVVARRQAAEYRTRLAAFMAGRGLKAPESSCPVCSTPQALQEPTKDDDKELVVLSCAHSLHNKCWESWVAEKSQAGKDICCPTCSEVVPVFVVN